jgi:prevent-host-death family protein
MDEIGVAEAKARLSEVLRRVEAGEEIAIRRGDRIVARLIPARLPGKRPLGVDAGRVEVPADFDAPLEGDVVR